MVKSDSDLSSREKGFPNGSAYTKELSEKDVAMLTTEARGFKHAIIKGFYL